MREQASAHASWRTMLKVTLSALVVPLIILLAIWYSHQSDDSANLVAEVLFPNEMESPIYNASVRLPVSVEIHSKTASEKIREYIAYFNEEIGVDVVAPVDSKNSDFGSEVLIIHQESKDGTFSNTFYDLYLREFGEEKTLRAEGLGYFSLDSTDSNPCFSVGIYDLDDHKFSSERTFTVINITVSKTNEELLRGCVLEELAHAVFGVADRDIGDSIQSIFNSNTATSYLSDFSHYDLIALRFIISGAGNGKESREELTRKLRSFIEGTH
jgi:hypothetical protein